jgi:hypothetical protein
MRTFDFAPFYRSTVGFDRVFSMLDQLGSVDTSVRVIPLQHRADWRERLSHLGRRRLALPRLISRLRRTKAG